MGECTRVLMQVLPEEKINLGSSVTVLTKILDRGVQPYLTCKCFAYGIGFAKDFLNQIFGKDFDWGAIKSDNDHKN